MSIRIEPNLSGGRAAAVGGKDWSGRAVGRTPAVGTNQSGNLAEAIGTFRLAADNETVIFVPDEAEEFAAVKAADESTGTD